MTNVKKRERKPVNKPVRFIEYLEILNLLPENLDDFLKSFSVVVEEFELKQKKIKNIQKENSKRMKEGKEPVMMPPEEFEQYLTPKETNIKTLFLELTKPLPEELKNHIGVYRDFGWREGERMLNMLAVERDSIDLLISQHELKKEFVKDFEDWKTTQKSESTNEDLYRRFCELMKQNPNVQNKYNAKKYELHIPSVNRIFLLPSINERLFYHRVAAGIERKGFKGFLTHLMEKDGFFDVWAQGLIGIIIERKLSGSPPIEIDRLRRCEFCNKFVYSYKKNKRHCSEQCYAADYARNKRNTLISLLQKKLKKAIARLENLESRLDGDSGLIKEQQKLTEELQNQINEEKMKNGTL